MSNQTRKNPVGIGRYIGQIIGYSIFALILGYFSASPDWVYFPSDKALVKLSFSHPGQRVHACKKRSARELANIPDSAKVPKSCPRERHPVEVVLRLNDKIAFQGKAQPAGLSKDGPATFYETFQVEPGHHSLVLEVKDRGPDKPGFRHEAEVDLRGRDILAIDLDRGALLLKLPTQ